MKIFGHRFPIYANHAEKLDKMPRKPNLFCLNDSGMQAGADEYNHKFLEKMFPEKSRFEK
jgi:hypothetical protein